MGDFDSPGVTNGAKNLGPLLVARWVVPPHPAHFVVKLCRHSCGGRRRGAAVHEYELEAFGSTGSSKVVEYLFDGTGLGGRSGDDAHAGR